jgi:serine/threonine-protein kinase
LADQDRTYSMRFEREARAAAALASQAVVTVYDTGVDDGGHYIVMEYVSGRNLEELLRQGRRFEIPQVLLIASRVADALAAAHAAGILHRDIKPANVMVADDGSVKVLDFGIARRLDGTAITQAASVMGTAAYMAPERALGEPGDARADIYSLGCLIYAMLTGAPPFTGEVSAAVLHQQINAAPRPPRDLRPDVPAGLEALTLAMLAKAPEERPVTADAVRDGLLHLTGAEARAPTSRLPAEAAGGTVPATAATRAIPAKAARGPRPSPRPLSGLATDHRRRAVVMALLTAVITLIAVALLSGGGSPHKATSLSGASTPGTAPVTSPTTPAATHAKAKPAGPNPSGPKPPDAQAADGTPPGHGSLPPGQAKKHGRRDGGGD